MNIRLQSSVVWKRLWVAAVASALLVLSGCIRNIQYSEHSPSISPDGKMMFYQSNRMGKDMYRLYVKYKIGNSWSVPVPLILANDITMSSAGPFVTYDQNYLIITSDRKGGVGDVDLWIAERKKDLIWGVPENMGAPINSTGYDGFASLSPDGSTLYFVRECPDKKGYDDDIFGIFISRKIQGQWTEPVRMPAPINTDSSEFGPIILADGRTLIFSSARPGGFGGYDLYKTERMGSGWSEPVNLGPSINTKKDDRMASIPASHESIYVSKPVGDSEVYRIVREPMPKALQFSSVITVAGVVSDRSEKGRTMGAEIKITDILSGETWVIRSNGEDGKYNIVLNKGREYDVAVSRPGYTFYSTKFNLKTVESYDAVIRDIELDPVRAGSTIVLNNLYFRLNSDAIENASRLELERLVLLMRENPSILIEVGGYTDQQGTAQFNMDLSLRRAEAVRRYLVMKGIAEKRIAVKGYGEDRSAETIGGKYEPDRQRRVEVRILAAN